MELSKSELSLIKSYLDAVRAQITGPGRDDTIADIELHIHAAIEASRKDRMEGDIVAAVLDELDAPEQYRPTRDQSDRASLTIYGLIGACLLPLTIPVIGHVAELTPVGEGSPMPAFYQSTFYQFVLLPLGVISPLIAMVLGWVGVQECRLSNGVKYGFPLAVIALVGAPMICVNLFVFIVYANVVYGSYAIPSLLAMLILVLVLFVNVWILRRTIARAQVSS